MSADVEKLLRDHNPEVRALVEQLRALVRTTVPTAVEKANPVWRSLNYHHPECGYFCGLFPQQNGVNLAFEFGVLLPDPDGLLEGDGKQVRYVRVKTSKDIRTRALRKLLLAALALPPKRDVKLGLIKAGARPVHTG